jgi:hypothetical protein
MTKFTKKVLLDIGIDPDKFTNEQLGVILMPYYAPENFYQDGEISHTRAMHLHNERLCRVNVNGKDRANALKLC